jgi:ligand-binding SRPBCC domain-containing protein
MNKMTCIYLETPISAPPKVCFDLSRSIDLHMTSMSASNERAVSGRLSGLIQKGEYVTWEATHFFIKQRLSSRIVEMVDPEYFVDEMISGAFKSMWHKHSFIQYNNSTVLIDDFRYEVPFGVIGKFLDWLVLKRYMKSLLIERNFVIKSKAEASTSS